jgi:predicted transcriptional regulator
MIIDLSAIASSLVGLFDLETVILYVLAFFSGTAGVMVYSRLSNLRSKRDFYADDAVVEAVVLEYTRRLRDYASQQAAHYLQPPSLQQSRQPQSHVTPASGPAAVTQHATTAEVEKPAEAQNGTNDYILKLLAERPRTSREVQHAIGRTREHTARLMKKLHDSGLVDRDANSKPFRYKITDSGRERLKEKEAASELPAAV